MSDRTVRRFVERSAARTIHRTRAPGRLRSRADEEPRSSCGPRGSAATLRARTSSPIFIGGWPPKWPKNDAPVSHPRWAPAPPPGRHRRLGRGRFGRRRTGGRPKPAGPDHAPADATQAQGTLDPNAGTWQAVGASADLPDGGCAGIRPRVGQRLRASQRGQPRGGFGGLHASGLQAVAGRTREPDCAALATPRRSRWKGDTLTHQLPVAPPPLPKFQVRETNGVIEVFAPTRSTCTTRRHHGAPRAD